MPSDVGQDLFGWSTDITCIELYRLLSTCARPLGHFSGTCVPDSAELFVQVDRGSWCGRPGRVVAVLSPSEGRDPVLSAVTLIVGIIVALTFLFGFGNVFTLALRLGVPVWVAPLVAPAVDLSVVGLLIAIRYLSMRGAPAEVIRPARRLLLASSVVRCGRSAVADRLGGSRTDSAAGAGRRISHRASGCRCPDRRLSQCCGRPARRGERGR